MSPAIADTGSSLLMLDPAIVNNYYAHVPTSTNNQQGKIFPCDTVLPDFSFGIGNDMATIQGSLLNYTSVPGTSGKNFPSSALNMLACTNKPVTCTRLLRGHPIKPWPWTKRLWRYHVCFTIRRLRCWCFADRICSSCIDLMLDNADHNVNIIIIVTSVVPGAIELGAWKVYSHSSICSHGYYSAQGNATVWETQDISSLVPLQWQPSPNLPTRATSR